MADGTSMLCSDEAMSRLAAIVESSQDAILSYSLEGILLTWNPAAERLFGYRADEVIGKPVSLLVPDDRPLEIADILARISRGQRVEHFETERRRKDGTTVNVSLAISPVWDASGAVVAASAIARDMTERNRKDAALQEAITKAEAANRAKSEFLSRMNHELRTPLNAILGFAQVLDMQDLPEDQGDSVREILTAGEHLLALIGEVLDISRVESGRLSLSVEEINLSDVLEESVALVRLLAAERHIDLHVSPVSTVAVVRADRQALKQILVNLLSNAIKYNREGGAIRVSASFVGSDRLRISVEDTGMGLSPAQLDRLFTPFERLGAETTSVQGSGLGLCLAKRLAGAMKGDLSAESTPGSGSIFSVELPGEVSVQASGVHAAEVDLERAEVAPQVQGEGYP